MTSPSPPPSFRLPPWSTRRALTLLALGTLVVSCVWRLPEALAFLGERTGELLVTLTFAAALTYLMRPLVKALCRTRFFGGQEREEKRRHGKRSLAVLLVFALVGGLIYAGGALSWKQISREVRDAEVVQSFMAKTPVERRAMLRNWRGTLKTALAPQFKSLNMDDKSINGVLDFAETQAQNLAPRLQLFARNLTGHLSFIVELLLLPVLVFYFLTDGPAIRRETDLLVPLAWRARFSHALSAFDRVFDGYVRGQIIMCLIAWALVSLLLLALRVPHWFTLGLVAGITRAVPIIGPLLGGVPLVVVALIETGDTRVTLVLVAAFTLMHVVESKILLPLVVGHEVDLHPVSVIIALLLGLKFFGLLGVFLSVPIAAAGKIFLAEWHESVAQRHATTPPVAEDAGEINTNVTNGPGAALNGFARGSAPASVAEPVADTIEEAPPL